MSRENLDAVIDGWSELAAASAFSPVWSPDGKSLAFIQGPADERSAWLLELSTGEKRPLLDVQRLRDDLTRLTGETPAGRGVPFAAFGFAADTVIAFGLGGRAFTLDLESSALTMQPLPNAMEAIMGLSPAARTTPRLVPSVLPLGDPVPAPELRSPDGAFLLSAQAGNLILRETVDGRETPLTSDGSRELEWRYDQDLGLRAGSAPTACWSPDSRVVAAYRVDHRGVYEAPQVHYLKRDDEVARRFFPKAGGVLEKYTLHLIDTYSGDVLDIDLGETRDTYPVFASWLPDGSGLVVFQLSRDCRRVDVHLADARTGTAKLLVTERGESNVRIHHDVYYGRRTGLRLTPDGTRFLCSSERDGWQHLYLYTLDGTLVRQLTRGDWPVDAVARISDDEVWFTGRPDQSRPYDRHLLRVSLDGGDVIRVTPDEGYHETAISPAGDHFVDSHSTVARPVVHQLRGRDGSLVAELATPTTTGFDALPHIEAREYQVLAADGETELWATVYLPPGFDESGSYPVIEWVYGGPQVTVRPFGYAGTATSSSGRYALGLAQLGYVTVLLDSRGTPLRSKAFHDAAYPTFAGCLAEDHAGAIQQLADKLPAIDLGRVGVIGGSWGGYTAFRLTVDRPDVYSAAVALAPGFDPYSSVLYECYLGMPRENKAGYDYAQTITLAAKLEKPLMIVGGTSDHATWTDSVKMVEALIQAGKEHDFVLLPEQYHGYDTVHDGYFRTKMTAFFRDNLS